MRIYWRLGDWRDCGLIGDLSIPALQNHSAINKSSITNKSAIRNPQSAILNPLYTDHDYANSLHVTVSGAVHHRRHRRHGAAQHHHHLHVDRADSERGQHQPDRFLEPAAQRGRPGVRDLRHRGRGGGSGGGSRHHPRVLPQQGKREHRRNESDALVMKYIWLIPLLPGIGAAINGLLGIRYFSRKVAGLVACAMMGAALVLSALAFWQLLGLAPDARFHDVV